MNSIINSDKQYVNSDFFHCVINPREITVYTHKEKKKKKNETEKRVAD